MRILSYNILEGGLGRIDPIAEVIRQADPDVCVLPEATDRAEFQKLADRLRMDAFLAPNPRNPDGCAGFLSRLPIREAVNYAPLDPRLTQAAFHAVVGLGTRDVVIVGLHLHARETLADEAVRLSELPAILEIARPFAQRPHVLAGDFNAHHPEQPLDLARIRQKTRERIAPQNNELPRETIRRLLEAGYVDAHTLGRTPAEYQTTLTTAQPALRTDYILVPAGLAGCVRRCEVLYGPGGAATPGIHRFASDHFPVLAEMDR